MLEKAVAGVGQARLDLVEPRRVGEVPCRKEIDSL